MEGTEDVGRCCRGGDSGRDIAFAMSCSFHGRGNVFCNWHASKDLMQKLQGLRSDFDMCMGGYSSLLAAEIGVPLWFPELDDVLEVKCDPF